MHTGIRTALIFALGLFGGLALAVPILFFALRTEAVQGLIRSSVVASQTWPDVTTLIQQAGGGSPEQTKAALDLLSAKLSVVVPSSEGTAEYAVALNGLFADLQAIASSTNQLGPLLVQMNSQSLSGDFTGFFDLVYRAKVLVAQQKAISAQFSQHLTALSAANQKTPNAVTRSLTQALLAAGQPVPVDFNSYLSTLDQLLSGSVPSAALIADMGAKAGVFSKDLEVFGASLQQLLVRFGTILGTAPTQ